MNVNMMLMVTLIPVRYIMRNKRLKTNDYREIANLAENLSKTLIAHHGIKKALLISKSTYEKVQANYKRLKEKYPNEY